MSSHRKEWEGTPGLGTTDPGKGGQGRESSTETSSDPEKWVISSPGTWALGRAIPLGNPQRSRPGQQPLATPGDFSSSQPSSTRYSPHPALPGPQLKCPGPPAASRSHISTHPPPQKVPPDGAGKDPHPGERETPRENGPTTSGSPGLPSHPSRAWVLRFKAITHPRLACGTAGTQGRVGHCGGRPGRCGISGSHPLNARTHAPTCDNHEVVTQ